MEFVDNENFGVRFNDTIENIVKLEIEEVSTPNDIESNDTSSIPSSISPTLRDLVIPKRIFQTHKSVEYVRSKPELVRAVNSWRRYVPEFGYYFYTDKMCDDFMRTEMIPIFGEKIYNVYTSLPIKVMKADLWRYCVIYKYGGIYADVDAICKLSPHFFVKFPSMLVGAPEDSIHLCQWTFAAPARSPLLKEIIELTMERVISVVRMHGEHIIHYLTGPGVFSDAIDHMLILNKMKTFTDRTKYEIHKNNIFYCYNHGFFHSNLIQHLYTGSKPGGWCAERDRLLK